MNTNCHYHWLGICYSEVTLVRLFLFHIIMVMHDLFCSTQYVVSSSDSLVAFLYIFYIIIVLEMGQTCVPIWALPQMCLKL